jgi:hypothetical protein
MDIKNLILSQLPENALDDLAEKVGVDNATVEKIIDAGIPEVIEQGSKTEGGLFDNLEESILSKSISEKTGLDEGTISKVLSFALPYIKDKIDSEELMKIIGGLSDGFGMDDIQNIAGAIMDTDEKDNSEKTENKTGGFLGNILGGLFGKK